MPLFRFTTTLSPGSAGDVIRSDGTDWLAKASWAAGLDAARPAAANSLIGSFYYATDTEALYYCDSATTWRVASARFGLDKAGLTPSATAMGPYCASPATAKAWTSGAIMFWPVALPSASEYLYAHHDTGLGRGALISIGMTAGDRGLLDFYIWGSGQLSLPGATVAGALGQVHCLAWAFTGGNIRYSWNGASVATTASIGPTAAQNGDPIGLCGRADDGSQPTTNERLIAVKTFSTVVGDSDLETISGSAARTACRIPTPSGATIAFDFNAARFTYGSGLLVASGERFTLGHQVYPQPGNLIKHDLT